MNIKQIQHFKKAENSLSVETCVRAYDMIIDLEYGNDKDYMRLLNRFIEACIYYSDYRNHWILYTHSEKSEIDATRTQYHNKVMSVTKELYEYMEDHAMNSYWYDLIGLNRKTIGDFAGFVAFVQGVNAR